MAVVSSFKNTELGSIPSDWIVESVSDLAHFENGKAHESFVSEYGKYTLVTSKFISSDGDSGRQTDISLAPAKKDDLLIVMSDVPNGRAIARCFLVPENDVYTVNQRIGVIRSKSSIPKWLFYVLNRNPYYLSFDDGAKQTNLRKQDILSCKVPVPSISEQEAIAVALSDADSLIESLERLVTKKRLILAALIEKLFCAESLWREFRLGDCAVLKARIGWQGLTTAEYLEVGNYGLVTGTDFKNGRIDWDNCHYVTKDRYDQDKNIQLKKNDVLVTKDGTIGKVAIIGSLPQPTTLNSGVFVIRPINSAFDPLCFYYLLRSKYFEDFLSQLSAGSTISHLYQKDFVHFKFKLPSLERQKEIGSILFDLDSDLEVHEEKLRKSRLIKQGMMQELLTGRIRLI